MKVVEEMRHPFRKIKKWGHQCSKNASILFCLSSFSIIFIITLACFHIITYFISRSFISSLQNLLLRDLFDLSTKVDCTCIPRGLLVEKNPYKLEEVGWLILDRKNKNGKECEKFEETCANIRNSKEHRQKKDWYC